MPVGADEAARIAVLPGNLQGPGEDIEVGLAIVLLHRPGHHVPAEAEVQGEALVHAPVVLRVVTGFPVAGLGITQHRTNLIVVHEANQQVGDFITASGSGRRRRRTG